MDIFNWYCDFVNVRDQVSSDVTSFILKPILFKKVCVALNGMYKYRSTNIFYLI